MASTWPELHAGTNFNYVWDVGTLAWVKETQPGGGGGGGGAVTVADGADIAEGATADAAWSGSGSGTVVSILKKIASSGTGGGPATIADGADVAQGTTTDAAITSDTSGTVIGFLRGLVKMFARVLLLDTSSYTTGSGYLTEIGGVYDDTPPTNLSNQTTGATRITQQRALHVNLRDRFGNEVPTTSVISLKVTETDPFSASDMIRISGGGHAVWLQDNAGNLISSGQADPASNTRGISVRDPQTVNVAASVASVDTKMTDGTQKTKLTDGVNTATVRAGSSAAAIGDTSLVVALNPNTAVIQTNTQQNIQSIVANGQSIDAAGLSQQYGTAVFEISNTWVGTLTFRGRDASGDAYKDISAVNLATGAVGTTTTVNGLYAIPVAGLYAVQVIATAWTSGQADVSNGLTGIPSAVSVSTPLTVGTSALPSGAATSAKQDTGNTSLASLDTKLGLVDSIPGAYSVLGRLKNVDDKLAKVATDATLQKLLAGLVKTPAPRPTATFLHVGIR